MKAIALAAMLALGAGSAGAVTLALDYEVPSIRDNSFYGENFLQGLPPGENFNVTLDLTLHSWITLYADDIVEMYDETNGLFAASGRTYYDLMIFGETFAGSASASREVQATKWDWYDKYPVGGVQHDFTISAKMNNVSWHDLFGRSVIGTYGSSRLVGTIDIEAIPAVPLPAGAVLMVSGLGLLGFARRKRVR